MDGSRIDLTKPKPLGAGANAGRRSPLANRSVKRGRAPREIVLVATLITVIHVAAGLAATEKGRGGRFPRDLVSHQSLKQQIVLLFCVRETC
jgi:hypothetical protein